MADHSTSQECADNIIDTTPLYHYTLPPHFTTALTIIEEKTILYIAILHSSQYAQNLTLVYHNDTSRWLCKN